ncbi:MAG: response regulator [Spirochaetaceae bacterium]
MSATETILVVDDETDILELITYNLETHGYTVVTVQSGEEALRRVGNTEPDLIVLDLMLPGQDGLSVCKALKADPATAAIPILMLTAKSEDSDVVRGLELGADDYLTKPFSPKVLVARIRAVLRRRSERGELGAAKSIRAGKLLIDRNRHEVRTDDGKKIDLSSTEFEILWFLASHPTWVFSRAKIIDAIRGEDYAVTERAVDVQILGLRRKLETYGSYIQTVRGVGYRLSPSE